MTERLTEPQCWALFERLFPHGLEDCAVVKVLAPDGWDQSPLRLVSHPTAEQVYEESLRIRENLKSLLRNESESPEEDPSLTLDAVRREMIDRVPGSLEECADLLGNCLWDVFSDNHDVVTADGLLVDLGSFRSCRWLHRRLPSPSQGFSRRPRPSK